jgi:hypothetical protein
MSSENLSAREIYLRAMKPFEGVGGLDAYNRAQRAAVDEYPQRGSAFDREAAIYGQQGFMAGVKWALTNLINKQ